MSGLVIVKWRSGQKLAALTQDCGLAYKRWGYCKQNMVCKFYNLFTTNQIKKPALEIIHNPSPQSLSLEYWWRFVYMLCVFQRPKQRRRVWGTPTMPPLTPTMCTCLSRHQAVNLHHTVRLQRRTCENEGTKHMAELLYCPKKDFTRTRISLCGLCYILLCGIKRNGVVPWFWFCICSLGPRQEIRHAVGYELE